MLKKAKERLKSERGASFSFALLLFLVCVVVSSLVLAASTASAGRFVSQGEADQRYYSVTSAAQLFSDALGGESGSVEYVFVQTRTGTQTIIRTPAGVAQKGEVVIDDSVTQATLQEPSATGGYDFLPNVMSHMLLGQASTALFAPSLDDALTDALVAKDWGEWVTPYETGAWPQEIRYKVKPSLNNGPTLEEDALTVHVTGSLSQDGRLELEFSNKPAGAEYAGADKYSLYMALSADIATSTETREQLRASTTVDADGNTVNVQDVTQVNTTTITWNIERIVPGRGLAADA